jgi:hypothetical protein
MIYASCGPARSRRRRARIAELEAAHADLEMKCAWALERIAALDGERRFLTSATVS